MKARAGNDPDIKIPAKTTMYWYAAAARADELERPPPRNRPSAMMKLPVETETAGAAGSRRRGGRRRRETKATIILVGLMQCVDQLEADPTAGGADEHPSYKPDGNHQRRRQIHRTRLGN